jgi:alcohol dehydrogenase class IV
MDPFQFTTAARIVFGRGRLDEIGGLAAELGRSALVVTNADRSGRQGLIDRVERLLSAEAVTAELFWIRGEPQIEHVDAALERARERGCDLIICLDYMEVIGEGRPIRRPAAPWVAVPTTAGTGAEVTRNAVIGSAQRAYKASIRSPLLLPRLALIDPVLGVGVPPEVTARSGMDALTQCIESYTSTGANPLTDALALEGVRRAAGSLRRGSAPCTDSPHRWANDSRYRTERFAQRCCPT